jgi:hypothetical protein
LGRIHDEALTHLCSAPKAFGVVHIARLTETLVTAALIAALKAATTVGLKWNSAALLKAHTANKLAMTLARTASGRLNMDFRIPALMSGVSR